MGAFSVLLGKVIIYKNMLDDFDDDLDSETEEEDLEGGDDLEDPFYREDEDAEDEDDFEEKGFHEDEEEEGERDY